MKGYLTALPPAPWRQPLRRLRRPSTTPAASARTPFTASGPALRTICDGPIEADGSWKRSRTFSARADYNVWYTPTFGFEGAPIPELQVGPDVYQVWPDAIPFGEPGHIAEGVVIP